MVTIQPGTIRRVIVVSHNNVGMIPGLPTGSTHIAQPPQLASISPLLADKSNTDSILASIKLQKRSLLPKAAVQRPVIALVDKHVDESARRDLALVVVGCSDEIVVCVVGVDTWSDAVGLGGAVVVGAGVAAVECHGDADEGVAIFFEA